MNKNEAKSSDPSERYRILFKGIVQGVGFRPYLYRSAKRFDLSGFVKNTGAGVTLEAEGKNLEGFLRYVLDHFPPLSEVVDYQVSQIPRQFSREFEILSTEDAGKSDLFVSPDIALCDNCRKELTLPTDRRYGYPFINCTDCGPRMTIIEDLPYDRPKTTMAKFPMCHQCAEEYHDPLDRRYHAQPVSCHHCGPTLSFFPSPHNLGNPGSNVVDLRKQQYTKGFPGVQAARRGEPIKSVQKSPLVAEGIKSTVLGCSPPWLEAAEKIKAGHIVAIKGLGGFHLACLASSDEAVLKLRKYKKRQRKPFALMGTLEMIRENCPVSETEKKHLLSSSAPILLLKKKDRVKVSFHVAPGQDTLGFMVPYTPLHVLLIQEINEPLVMTSANFSDEPIIYKDDSEALGALSDYILTHDRDIYLFADDSVAQVVDDRLYMLRRSRGYVPFPLTIPFHSPGIILGLGPMLKTTFTVIRGNKALTSSYIGDTESPAAIEAQRFAIRHYMKLFSFQPGIVAMDKHPEYPNRLLAREFKGARVVEIQHHKAHVGSLLAETGETGPVIGISMDGTGYGDDGNIWGGEFFVGDYKGLTRFGHLKYLFLPAGDKSVKEPWRFALSVLHSLYGPDHAEVSKFAEKFGDKGFHQLEIIKKGSSIGKFGVLTSSCGRVFDAVASLLGIGHFNDFDGDLPSLLQALAQKSPGGDDSYRFSLENDEKITVLNLLPLFHDIIQDKRNVPEKAFIFHNTLAQGIVSMAERAREVFHINKAGLTGGVFQNTLLLELTRSGLKQKGFQVLVHAEIPANDGGISLGQAYLAMNENVSGK